MTERDELGVALAALEFEQALEVIGVLVRANPKVVTLDAVRDWAAHNCTKIAWLAFNDKLPPSPFFMTRYHKALTEIANAAIPLTSYGVGSMLGVCEDMQKIARKALGKV